MYLYYQDHLPMGRKINRIKDSFKWLIIAKCIGRANKAPCNRISEVIYRGRVSLTGMINAKFIPSEFAINKF
jgi:hypothetical protein